MAEPEDLKSVPWPDIVRFVRQLSHDLRNQLNAAELQSAYISEVATDAEMKSEVKRLREMISGLARTLQQLSGDLQSPKPTTIDYKAADFIEDLQKRVAHDFSEQKSSIKWNVDLGDETFEIDPQLLQPVFLELLGNAFQHGREPGDLTASARVEKKRFVFSLTEPKKKFELSTENWGREPLRQVGRGHYGLGLNRARSIVEAHNGELRASFDSKNSKFVTTITLPLSVPDK